MVCRREIVIIRADTVHRLHALVAGCSLVYKKKDAEFPAGAVKLADGLAGESPASASFPVGAAVISGDGAGDQTIGSPEARLSF